MTLTVAIWPLQRQVDGCTVMDGPQSGAYAAFVDHILYSAEQMLEVGEGWEPTF